MYIVTKVRPPGLPKEDVALRERLGQLGRAVLAAGPERASLYIYIYICIYVTYIYIYIYVYMRDFPL